MVQMRMLVVRVTLIGHLNINGWGRMASIYSIEPLEQPSPSITVPFLAVEVVVLEAMAKYAASVITCRGKGHALSIIVPVLPELVDGSLNVGHGCCHYCPVVYDCLCCFILFCQGLKQCPKGCRGIWRAHGVVD